MWAIVITILKWLSAFMIARLIAKIAGLIVFTGISLAIVGYVVDEIEAAASGAPAEWLQVTQIMGIWEAIGIITGAFTFKLLLNQFSIGPSSLITG